jgi:hypothetical protein
MTYLTRSVKKINDEKHFHKKEFTNKIQVVEQDKCPITIELVVDIDFDDSSKCWRENKNCLKNGMFSYNEKMYVGRSIVKKFSKEYFSGVVKSFSKPYYCIEYSDGDVEELSITKLKKHLVL